MLKKRLSRKKNALYKRNFIFPVIFVLAVLIFLFTDMGIIKWYQLRQERYQIQVEIEDLILEEKKLIEELDNLENNDDYIKKIARERFHMVRPGEKIFRVIDRRKVKKNN